MIVLREWWSQPTDYAWAVRYTQSHPLLRGTRTAIGVYCWAYGLACLLAIMTPVVSPSPIARAIVLLFGASTIVVGVAWFRGPWPTHRQSLLFVTYAEIGVTSVLFALADPAIALLCSVLLAVMGNYISAFHNAKAFLAHQVWSLATCAVLYTLTITDTDVVVAQATAYLLVLVLVLVSSPLLTQVYLMLLRRDAAVAHFDPLTGMRNRRGLESAVLGLPPAAVGVSVLVADLDNFKSVNDNHGHSYGDDVLRRTAQALNETFPSPAITARTGGEEFVVVVAGPLDTTSAAAERLRLAIPGCNDVGHTTTSIGIHFRHMSARTVADHIDELLDSADAAMYEAKRHGGDSIVIDSQDDIRFCR